MLIFLVQTPPLSSSIFQYSLVNKRIIFDPFNRDDRDIYGSPEFFKWMRFTCLRMLPIISPECIINTVASHLLNSAQYDRFIDTNVPLAIINHPFHTERHDNLTKIAAGAEILLRFS